MFHPVVLCLRSNGTLYKRRRLLTAWQRFVVRLVIEESLSHFDNNNKYKLTLHRLGSCRSRSVAYGGETRWLFEMVSGLKL